MASDLTKALEENNCQIRLLHAEIEKKVSSLPEDLQSIPIPVLVNQIAPIFELGNCGSQLHITSSKTGTCGKAGYMAVVEKALISKVSSEFLAEDSAREKEVLRRLQEEIMDASSPNLLDERDMHVFEQFPLVDDLKLVVCNGCHKPIKESHYAQHAERCPLLINADEDVAQLDVLTATTAQKPPRKARRKTRDGDPFRGNPAFEGEDNFGSGGGQESQSGGGAFNNGKTGGTKRVQEADNTEELITGVDSDAAMKPLNKANQLSESISPRKRAKVSSQKGKLMGEESDILCGVVSTHTGAPCRRELTQCKYHSEASKRAVLGRSKPFDVLIQEAKTHGVARSTVVDGVVGGAYRAYGFGRPVSPSQPWAPLPLATKRYCLRLRHGMRGVVGAMFREACTRSAVHSFQPVGGKQAPGSALLNVPTSVTKAPNTASLPILTTPVDLKKTKTRPKRSANLPPQASPSAETPTSPPATWKSPVEVHELSGEGKEGKGKAKGRAKAPSETKPAIQPVLAGALAQPKSKASKSLKQQKSLQRIQQDQHQEVLKMHLLETVPNLQLQQQQQQQQQLQQLQLQQQQHQQLSLAPSLDQEVGGQGQSKLLPQTQTQGQPLPYHLPELVQQLPGLRPPQMLHLGSIETAQGPGGNSSSAHSLGLSDGSGFCTQETYPLHRLLAGGLGPPAHGTGHSTVGMLGFPPPSGVHMLSSPLQPPVLSPSGSAMLAGSATDWGALP